MTDRHLERIPIITQFEQFGGKPPPRLELERKTLRGGLEGADVALVTARYRDASGRPRMFRFVSKRLDGPAVREAAIYERLAETHAGGTSPRLLAVEYPAPDRALLCVEAVRRTRAWPWRDSPAARDLLARLAQFHIAAKAAEPAIPEWDYETELAASAEATWEALDRCRYDPDLSALARYGPQVRRAILALPEQRRQLLSELPFGSGPIHGDVHPGNALMRRRGGGEEPVLLDWARARIGSPLEDVSSWLQSLGYFEDGARRFHDTLLKAYLSAFGLDRRLTSGVRSAYWLSGASNALAGALRHHLYIALDGGQSAGRRASAAEAARDWLRVVRRADAWWS